MWHSHSWSQTCWHANCSSTICNKSLRILKKKTDQNWNQFEWILKWIQFVLSKCLSFHHCYALRRNIVEKRIQKKWKINQTMKSFIMMKTIELIKNNQRALNFVLWICWKNCSLWPENWFDELTWWIVTKTESCYEKLKKNMF